MGNVLTVPKAAARARSEGIQISEYTFRTWIKRGLIPVRMIGNKPLLYYPNLISYLQCEDGGDIRPVAEGTDGIRRIY